MTNKTLIEKLKIEKKKWENQIYGVGETRIDLMIDDVVKELQTQQEEIDLYNETEIALNNRIMDLEAEIEKKDTLINTMQAEFERLENLEDNTDMLKEELKKKDKIIDNSINEIEKIRQYFSEDLQVEFIRILEILKDKKVIDW